MGISNNKPCTHRSVPFIASHLQNEPSLPVLQKPIQTLYLWFFGNCHIVKLFKYRAQMRHAKGKGFLFLISAAMILCFPSLCPSFLHNKYSTAFPTITPHAPGLWNILDSWTHIHKPIIACTLNYSFMTTLWLWPGSGLSHPEKFSTIQWATNTVSPKISKPNLKREPPQFQVYPSVGSLSFNLRILLDFFQCFHIYSSIL